MLVTLIGIVLGVIISYCLILTDTQIIAFFLSKCSLPLLGIIVRVLGALLVLLLVGFIIDKKVKPFIGKKLILSIYWTIVFIAPIFITHECRLYAIGCNPGFTIDYSFLRLEKQFVLTNQFIADSNGITKANREYYLANQPDIYINKDGFRSREFTDTCAGQKRILLLGDSFVWGLSAKPFDNSFADILGHKYCIYNTGIVGADPIQYEAIVKAYAPVIKPHVTCIFVFAGNDLYNVERKLQPLVPNHFWAENMGVSSYHIDGCGEVSYLNSPEEAYKFALDRYSLHTKKNFWHKALAKTNIGTQAYFLMSSDPEYPCSQKQLENLTKLVPLFKNKVVDIKQIVEEQGGKAILFVIPDKNKIPRSLAELHQIYPDEFTGLEVFCPLDLTIDDYALGGDAHFNNQGHAKFTKYVEGVIDSAVNSL